MTTLDSNPRYTFDTQLVTEYAPWRRQRLSINRLHERLDTRSYKMLDDAMELATTVLGTYRLQVVVLNLADELKHQAEYGYIGQWRQQFIAGPYIKNLRENKVSVNIEQTFPDVATATVSFLTQDSPVFGTWVVTMSRLVDTSDGPTSELLEIAERFSQLSWRLGMT